MVTQNDRNSSTAKAQSPQPRIHEATHRSVRDSIAEDPAGIAPESDSGRIAVGLQNSVQTRQRDGYGAATILFVVQLAFGVSSENALLCNVPASRSMVRESMMRLLTVMTCPGWTKTQRWGMVCLFVVIT